MLGITGPVPRAILLQQLGWKRFSAVYTERAIMLWTRALADRRYSCAATVMEVAAQTPGTWTAAMETTTQGLGIRRPRAAAPAPRTARRKRWALLQRAQVRRAITASEQRWWHDQRAGLERTTHWRWGLRDLLAAGCPPADVRTWAQLALQGALRADSVGQVPECRLCGASLETTAHLVTHCPGTAAWRAAAATRGAPASPAALAGWLLGGADLTAAADAAREARELGAVVEKAGPPQQWGRPRQP